MKHDCYSLAAQVFSALVDRLTKRQESISAFAQSGFSFEEWINWEFFDAIRFADDLTVTPKSSYTSAENRKVFADLVVRSQEIELVIEVALCHDNTHSKWVGKIDADALKLTGARKQNTHTLQVVIVVTSDIRKGWDDFLKAIGWDQPTKFTHGIVADLRPRGAKQKQIWTRAWLDYIVLVQ